MWCVEIQIGGNRFREIRILFRDIVIFYENQSISVKNIDFCDKDLRFLIFMRKRRTFSERGCHVREFCEKDARFPWVEFVDVPNNSLKIHNKRTNSQNVPFPRESAPPDSGVVQNQCQIKSRSPPHREKIRK